MSGKRFKEDVSDYSLKLFHNLNNLYYDLINKRYKHDNYLYFKVNDQKPRDIHKAMVKDRIVHRLIYDVLYRYFDDKFIFDSYSCRKGKGVHKAILKYQSFARKISKNYTKQVWVLKFDIKKCFASVDQNILLEILNKYIEDEELMLIIKELIFSFDRGLPLGNLTSQLFINVYLNELDYFVKDILRQKYYIRYADDFVIFNSSKEELNSLYFEIKSFLKTNLKLDIHENIDIRTIYSGVSFLGWKHFPKYRILRKSTKNRAQIGLKSKNEKVVNSYLGLLKWGNTYKIIKKCKV